MEEQIGHLRAELLHKEQETQRVQLQLAKEVEERERAERKVCLLLVSMRSCISAVTVVAWERCAAAAGLAVEQRKRAERTVRKQLQLLPFVSLENVSDLSTRRAQDALLGSNGALLLLTQRLHDAEGSGRTCTEEGQGQMKADCASDLQVLGLNRFIMTDAREQDNSEEAQADVPRNRRQTWAMGAPGEHFSNLRRMESAVPGCLTSMRTSSNNSGSLHTAAEQHEHAVQSASDLGHGRARRARDGCSGCMSGLRCQYAGTRIQRLEHA